MVGLHVALKQTKNTRPLCIHYALVSYSKISPKYFSTQITRRSDSDIKDHKDTGGRRRRIIDSCYHLDAVRKDSNARPVRTARAST